MKKILLVSIIALFALTGCTIKQNEKSVDISDSQIVFAVIGDNEGDTPMYRAFLKDIAQQDDVDFVLHVGDAVANGGSEEIKALLALHSEYGMTKPFYPVVGNHDTIDDPGRAAFFENFSALPRSIDIDNLHLVLLDNGERKIGFSDATLNWLENDLEAAVGKMVILAFHRPFGYPLSETFGDDETRTSRESNDKLQTILLQYNIAQIFNGHIHTYIEFPFLMKDDEGSVISSIPAVVSGGGGQEPQDIFSTIFSEDFHYLRVTVKDGKIDIEKKSYLGGNLGFE